MIDRCVIGAGLLLGVAGANAADTVLVSDVWNGNAYLVVYRPEGLDWNEAKAAAESDFGQAAHLVVVTTPEENAVVGSLVTDPAALPTWFTDVYNNGIGPWMGGFQNDGDPFNDPFGPAGAWEWITGDPWEYTNWSPNNPDDFMGGEDFLHYFGFLTPVGEWWNDVGMSPGITGYVVEVECAADCNADGQLNILDFVCFQSEWQAQTFAGDCDANGQFNILDFVCYQTRFQAGCP